MCIRDRPIPEIGRVLSEYDPNPGSGNSSIHRCRRHVKTDPGRQPRVDLLPDPGLLLKVRRKQVLDVEDWAEIRRLHRSERMPVYRRKAPGSIVDEVEPRIRELLAACPTMPASRTTYRPGEVA